VYVDGVFDVLKHLLHLLDYHARPTGTPWEGRRVEPQPVLRNQASNLTEEPRAASAGRGG